MAFDLLSLLGQAAGAEFPVDMGNGDYAPDGSSDIVVGRRIPYDPRKDPERPQYNDPAPRPQITPEYILNDNRMQPTEGELEELLPRKGVFGTKGTLRDILGTLGDAFLLQGGADRVYAPQREAEKQGDAMFGFTQNPLEAFERLAAAGFQKEAQALYKDYQTNQYQQGQLASNDANRRSQIENRNFDNQEIGWNRVSRWIKGGMPYDRVVAGAARYNISPEELAEQGITPEMSDTDRSQFAFGDMTINQQMNYPLARERVDIARDNSVSQRISATKPRAGRAPARETDSERYIRLMDQDPGDLSAGERAWAKKYGKGEGRGSNLTIPPKAGTKRPPLSSFKK